MSPLLDYSLVANCSKFSMSIYLFFASSLNLHEIALRTALYYCSTILEYLPLYVAILYITKYVFCDASENWQLNLQE